MLESTFKEILSVTNEINNHHESVSVKEHVIIKIVELTLAE